MNIDVRRSVRSVMHLIHQCLWPPASSTSCFISLCPLVKPKKILGESLRCQRASRSGFDCALPRLSVNSTLFLFALFCYSNRNKRKKFSSLFRKEIFSLLLVWKHQTAGARNGSWTIPADVSSYGIAWGRRRVAAIICFFSFPALF